MGKLWSVATLALAILLGLVTWCVCLADPAADLKQGSDLIAAKQYDEAIKLLGSVKSADSSLAPQALEMIGDCYRLKEDFGRAAESYEVECSGISAYLHALLHAGILRDRAGRLSTDNLVCRVVEGCFLFVTNEFGGEIPAYFGDDSIKLTRHLGGFPGQHGLDVCCGSGIQSILMARRGLSVVGLDIQKAALRLARINSRINRIDHMVTFVHADVREYRSEETYDVVVSNPPLLPIPSGMDYSVVGDGGESGLEITNEVVRLFCKHANSKAQAVVIGMCLGSGRSLELVDWLETIAGPNSLSCQVWLLMQKDALSMGELSSLTSHVHFGGPYNAALQQWVDMCAERGADHCYAFLLKLSRGYMPSSVAVIPLYERCASNGWYVT